ncbi:MAG: hypothetical protein Q7P63_06295 [Verrucomicrobiota bacterium JB022]|nr:hypothetical protein [Verrucomicrobiota bacterium JB022]
MLLWNAVFGTLGDAILCLHPGFAAHFELKEQECHGECPAEPEAHAAEFQLADDHCPPCVDIRVRGQSLESQLSPRMAVPLPDASALVVDWLPELNLPAVRLLETSSGPRAPPSEAPPQSVVIVRTHVLRV